MAEKLSRSELIEKARLLIKSQPAAGRREIAKDMRREYGQALRDAVILSLQREIYPRPQQATETKRKVRLEYEGFLPFETRQLKKQTFKNAGFLNKERRARAKEHRSFIAEQKAAGITKKQAEKAWRDSINQRYIDKGYIIEKEIKRKGEKQVKVKPDPWQYFRDIRADAIKSGQWKETPRYRGKSHRKLTKAGTHAKLDKGKLKQQRQRYREKQKSKKVSSRRNR